MDGNSEVEFTLAVPMDRSYAYISITGSGNTSAITESLGLEPTNFWNVGDKRSKGSPYEFARWDFKDAAFEKEFLDEALNAVVQFIEEKNLQLTQLPGDFEACIQCVGYHEQASPGFHLSRELLTRLGNLGIAIDFDLYCHAERTG